MDRSIIQLVFEDAKIVPKVFTGISDLSFVFGQ